MVEWQKIKADYLSGGTSYRKLAKMYNGPRTTLERKAKDEKWADLRRQAEGKAEAQIVNAISKKKANIDDKYFRLVDKLFDKAEEVIDNTPIWQPSSLKEMATTMKYLKECKGVKSEADIREQEARIRRLEMEASIREEDDDKPSGVVLIPSIAEELKPPIEEDGDE